MDKNSAEYKRVKEKIAEALYMKYSVGEKFWGSARKIDWYKMTDQILSVKGIAIKADDQSLRDELLILPKGVTEDSREVKMRRAGYSQAQLDMKDFRKVI